MKKWFVLSLVAVALFGCMQDEAVIEESSNVDTNSIISFVVTPSFGETLTVCDTIYIQFSSRVLPTADEYGNISFTRYNGPASVAINHNHWSATFIPASYKYDDTTNLLMMFFEIESSSITSLYESIMNIGVSIRPQYLHGENGEDIETPSLNENGEYFIEYEYLDKISCPE